MNSKDILVNGGRKLGFDIDNCIVNKFIKFKDILLEWNEKINLTGITKDDEIMIKHFLDSMTCILTGVVKHDSKIIDVGTGAGFPGVPLKIYYQDLNLTLLDSLNKRIKYLEKVCTDVELKEVELVHGRAEDVAKDKLYREQFDIAVARAVADLRILSEYCLPFVKIGGYFISQKGPDIEEELKESKKAIEVLGGKIEDNIKIQLPYSDINHSLVVIKKISETPKKYPRKAGTPTKNPIM